MESLASHLGGTLKAGQKKGEKKKDSGDADRDLRLRASFVKVAGGGCFLDGDLP